MVQATADQQHMNVWTERAQTEKRAQRIHALWIDWLSERSYLWKGYVCATNNISVEK